MWWQIDPKAEALYGLSPYNSMANNPILFNDPNGDFIHIVIGAAIGGVGNLIYQAATGNIQSLGDGLVAFGIGAGAGALGAATGGASLAAMGTASGVGGAIAAGATAGFAGGAAAGFVQGAGNSLYFQNGDLNDILNAGIEGAFYGGVSGAVLGGIGGGIAYKPGAPGSGVNPAVQQGGNAVATNDATANASLALGRPVAQMEGGKLVYLNSQGKWVPVTKEVLAQSGLKALPRGVSASWGKVFNYRHGGKMSAIEHIFYRHSYNTGFEGVSKFSQNTSAKMIKTYVDQTLKYGAPIKNGFEYNFGRTIGTGSNGLPATSIRVYVRDGWIRTAFPFN